MLVGTSPRDLHYGPATESLTHLLLATYGFPSWMAETVRGLRQGRMSGVLAARVIESGTIPSWVLQL